MLDKVRPRGSDDVSEAQRLIISMPAYRTGEERSRVLASYGLAAL
jgi:hypothetical protein